MGVEGPAEDVATTRPPRTNLTEGEAQRAVRAHTPAHKSEPQADSERIIMESNNSLSNALGHLARASESPEQIEESAGPGIRNANFDLTCALRCLAAFRQAPEQENEPIGADDDDNLPSEFESAWT
jgi:hypothetical protein